ncbi:MAG: DUF433 domain-containing protein [Pseudomonadota bacterium]|nr:DUF433 domain-containing protein [Pseudomonadota bacterium]
MADQYIHRDPSIMMGKPVIAHTRITVELILEKLGSGKTADQMLAAHPRLKIAAVAAALAFAAGQFRLRWVWQA